MSCFAIPLDGRPTRRARRSSSSVDFGMSEKSICESGIGLTLPSARQPRADDPEFFFFMIRPPYRVHDEQEPLAYRKTKPLEPLFLVRMGDIVPLEPVGIAEDSGRFFEWNTVFLEIGNGLWDVPRKHATVYTVIRSALQSASPSLNLRVYNEGLPRPRVARARLSLHSLTPSKLARTSFQGVVWIYSSAARRFLTRLIHWQIFSPALPPDCFAIDFPRRAMSQSEGLLVPSPHHHSSLPREQPNCPRIEGHILIVRPPQARRDVSPRKDEQAVRRKHEGG
jgi:hypothetical protein